MIKKYLITLITLTLYVTAVEGQNKDSTNTENLFLKEKLRIISFSDFPGFVFSIPLLNIRTNFAPGYPVYTGMKGLSSKQTHFLFNGVSLNDPMTGRFNLHNLAPDLIAGTSVQYNGDKSGNPLTLIFLPIKTPENHSYTRAIYQYNTGTESSIGITFSQPLLKGLKYKAGFSLRKYNNLNSDKQNKYNNSFVIINSQLYKNWQTNYTLLRSDNSLLLNHSIVVSADSAVLKDPVQDQILTNHIFTIKNDSIKFRPEFTFHRMTNTLSLGQFESQNKYTINSSRNSFTCSAGFKFRKIDITFGMQFTSNNATVKDSLNYKNTEFKSSITSTIFIGKKSIFTLGIFPQKFNSNNFNLGFSGKYKLKLYDKFHLTSSFSRLLRNPVLSEVSGIHIFSTVPNSVTFYNLALLDRNHITNKNLMPEEIRTGEISINYSDKILNTKIAVYSSELNRLIIPELTQQGVIFNNSGTETDAGIRTVLNFSPLRQTGILFTNNFLFKNNSSFNPDINGSLAIYAHMILFTGDIDLILAPSIRFWSGYQLFDFEYGNYQRTVKVNSGAIFNFKAVMKIMKNAHVNFEVTNVTGINPFINNIQYLPERTFLASILWELFD
ncbi:hypothetical protein DRQ07_03145 [candidate division KSB1 bacterium]|nr:MAG: hypothetical protein DRQ07_03145 [candidate division KSB1 bacterium]